MDDIIDIEECGIFRAKKYLAAGYRLLAINGTSREERSNKARANAGEWYVRRGVTYTVGRTRDIAALEEGERAAEEVAAQALYRAATKEPVAV